MQCGAVQCGAVQCSAANTAAACCSALNAVQAFKRRHFLRAQALSCWERKRNQWKKMPLRIWRGKEVLIPPLRSCECTQACGDSITTAWGSCAQLIPTYFASLTRQMWLYFQHKPTIPWLQCSQVRYTDVSASLSVQLCTVEAALRAWGSRNWTTMYSSVVVMGRRAKIKNYTPSGLLYTEKLCVLLINVSTRKPQECSEK